MEILKKFDDNLKTRQSSYKMVTVLSMLDACDENGIAFVDDVVENFKSFYLQRYEKGKVVEKQDISLTKIAHIDTSSIKSTLLRMPVYYLQDKGLINYDKDNQVLSFPQEFTEVLDYKTEKELRRITFKHLHEYYKSFGGLGLTKEDFWDLPLEYPASADDVAALSGQNRVKGIHPIDKEYFKAVIILCTLGGSNYLNQWIDEENGVLKYYAEGRTGSDGVKNYNLEMRSNKAIIDSKEEGVPLYVFIRETRGELFHYAGEFEYQGFEEEDTGDIYFVLNKKEVSNKKVSLPDVSKEALIQAMEQFDHDYRSTDEWREWDKKPNQKYAIDYNNQYYPPKMIISLATGVSRNQFSGGSQSNEFLRQRGFSIVPLNTDDEDEQNYEAELDIVGDEDVKTVIEDVERYIEGKGFEFEKDFIKNLFLSFKTKPFVILAGISGTGKSQLGELFANALGANRENRRFRLVSVRPDWNDSTDLLGYLNLQNEFVKGPLTEILEVALENPRQPYFVCLDEMNLARVEYYFSEFLSIIESRRWAGNNIISAPIENKGHPNNGELFFPSNLYVIGTVNMDETTHSFSRKVLDRANTIELSQVDLSKMPTLQEAMQPPYNIENSFLQSSFLTLKDCLPEYQEYLQEIIPELESINGILENLGLHVGYRVRDEFSFYMIYNRKFELLEEKKCIDLQILQKVLPRIYGSSIEVEEVLGELKSYCEEQGYELSSSKLDFMLRRYNRDGFTSFWA